MIDDWEDAILMKLAKPQELTDRDRELIVTVLEEVMDRMKDPDEVHWPVPRAAMYDPHGQHLWLTRWLTKRAGVMS